MTTTIADDVFFYLSTYGWALVPLRGKVPIGGKDWGAKAITDPDKGFGYWTRNPDHGVGLSLGPSYMCSLDIDCEPEHWALILAAIGAPPNALDGCLGVRGRGVRYLFRVPSHLELKYRKLNWPHREAPHPAKQTMFELRVAPADVARQDVLPPSIHPDTGRPYEWLDADALPETFDAWPEPPGWLLELWDNWDKWAPKLTNLCPWRERDVYEVEADGDEQLPLPAPRPALRLLDSGETPIERYNRENSVGDVLNRHGYKYDGGANRWLSPGSSTKVPGIFLAEDGQRVWCYHGSDNIDTVTKGKPASAFDVWCAINHGGDVKRAVSELAKQYAPPPAVAPAATPARPPVEVEARGTPPAQHSEHWSSLRDAPFIALGFDGGTHYYRPLETQQIVQLKAGKHDRPSELMQLAPLAWWEANFWSDTGKGGINWKAACDWCLRYSATKGIFSDTKLRGRGVWEDEGRSVVHLGDRLVVDGETCSLDGISSWFVYDRRESVRRFGGVAPLSSQSASLFRELCDSLNWVSRGSGRLLAGWVVSGLVTGSVPWRSHILVTSPRGGGKTWVLENIVMLVLGDMSLNVVQPATEAGIRMKLQTDALPVIIDEFEPESAAGMDRINAIYELFRACSPSAGATIMKGTADQRVATYRIKATVCLGGINTTFTRASDISRFTVLELGPSAGPEHFSKVKALQRMVANPDYLEALRARIVGMSPIIAQSARIFAEVAAEGLGEARMGDQLGTLLAGAYALESDEVVTEEVARAQVAEYVAAGMKETAAATDEESLLSAMLSKLVEYEGVDLRAQKASLGALVQRAAGETVDELAFVQPADADRGLRRYGMTVRDGYLCVANKHTELAALMKSTPWASGWANILKRVPGADTNENRTVKIAGVVSKVVRVPLSVL